MQNQTPRVHWQVDPEGYLLTPSGCKACRLGADGVLYIWDKRDKREIPLTPEALGWARREWDRKQTQHKG